MWYCDGSENWVWFSIYKRLHLMYVNQFLHALLTVECSTFLSDQKSVRDFPWKAFHLRCFFFKSCVTHFNDATYSKTCTTVGRLAERVDEFFKQLLKSCFQKTWSILPFFHLIVRHPIHIQKKDPIEKHHWWGSSRGIFRFGKKFHYWCFGVLKFPDQLFYRTFSDGCLWWRLSYV